MGRRSVLAMFAVLAIVLGCVVVTSPASAVIDSAVVVPSPSPGINGNFPTSVSCVTVSFCVATGYYYTGSVSLTLVEQWDGANWTVIPSPNTGTDGNFPTSVSCATVSFCVTTGYYSNGSTNKTLVEQWDGANWTVIPSPNTGTGTTGNFLNSVSCATVSFCITTGFYENGSATQTLVEQWDGASWTILPSAGPGTGSNTLNSVSCVAVSFCIATGWYYSAPATQTLMMSLTGPVPPTTTTTMPSDRVAPAFTG